MSKWKSIVVGQTADGKMKILHGPEVADDLQRAYVQDMKAAGEMPKGLIRVELLTRSAGVTKCVAVEKGETPEERITREVCSLRHEEILAALTSPKAAEKRDKSKAEAALIRQRGAGTPDAAAKAPPLPDPTDDTGDAGEDDEPPVMGAAR